VSRTLAVASFPGSPSPRWPTVVAALGNFDGVHRGHQTLLDRVRRQAAEIGGSPVAVTFDPHPSLVLRPDKAPPLILTLDQKLEAFERAGMHGVVVVHFTPELSRWEPERFVDETLVAWLGVAEVWVGANFLFGRDRAGTFTLLRALGQDRGFRAEKIDPIRYRDFVVSSTRIRHLISEGRVDLAGALLGHQFFIDGEVVHGDGRGRELGFPTANLRTDNALLPANGIYATIATIDGVHHPSVSSVGTRPTVGGGPVTIEAFLLEGGGNLYGRRVRLSFVQWLREEVRFDGLEPLRAQMSRDADAARALFATRVL
jgi:riboflavin kinase/FMN adenylyltransferase